jgi:drug/metabolite transporter (DMT)-like permease
MNGERQQPNGHLWAHVALLAVSLTFGGNYVIAKFAFREITPLSMVVFRTVGAALILGTVLLFKRKSDAPKIQAREFGELFLYSLFGISFNMWCFLEGLSRSSATNASIMLVAIPVMTLGFAILLKRERATTRGVAGIALGLAGALILIVPKGGMAISGEAMTGNIFLFTGAASYSLYLVVSKPILSRHDPLVVVTWIFTMAGLTMLPFGFSGLRTIAETGLSTGGTWSLVYIIVGATAVPYLLNTWALKRVASSIVAVYILVQPIVAGWLGNVFLGEHFGANAAVAAALIVTGVGMAVWRPRAGGGLRTKPS